MKKDGTITEFSAASRDYYRIDMPRVKGRHQATICTTANNHLLVWNAGAVNEKGMEAIVATLGSITALPRPTAQESAQSERPDDAPRESQNTQAQSTREKVSDEIIYGLMIRKVRPVYPESARSAHIQGTVVLEAQISKAGDITDLELVDGPIELAGSAITAVRQWKYRPYLLKGEPVDVETQVEVHYELQR